jgi:mono/diheme cytochrome c family protein
MFIRRALIGLAVAGVCGLAAGETQTSAPAAKAPAGQTRPASKTPVDSSKQPETFGIGRPASPEEIAALDIDVGPDGTGLPPGSATSADGAPIYAAKCASCHGATGKEGPNDRLVGRAPGDAFSFGRDPATPKTIGSYWPYATTVFDYIRRAMPPTAPGSLSNQDVYALTAYLLTLNDLISADTVVDAASLPKVKMPARDHFIPDPRGGPKVAPMPVKPK